MWEWRSYPAGREMGLPPRNIAVELGVQNCPECPHTSQSSCLQSQELTDPGQTTRNTPHYYASTTKLNSRYNAVTKEKLRRTSAKPETRPSGCQTARRDLSLKEQFSTCHSPMIVSSTPLQTLLRILWSDVWLVSGCTTMESQIF
ncbi:hypothetical protein TNCV_3728611 [Trichonephila clavipes]|nr:hypothetical protein TNCV_3728611 [Trichonephila clavipes]